MQTTLCGHRGRRTNIGGNIAEIQLMYANLAVQDGLFTTVKAALHTMSMRQGQNKLAVEEWLGTIGIGTKDVRIASFLHVPLATLQAVWPHLVTIFGRTKTARMAFVARMLLQLFCWTLILLL